MQAQFLRGCQAILGLLDEVSLARLNHVVVHIHSILLLHALLFLGRLCLDVHLLQAAGVHPEGVRRQDGVVDEIVVVWRDDMV